MLCYDGADGAACLLYCELRAHTKNKSLRARLQFYDTERCERPVMNMFITSDTLWFLVYWGRYRLPRAAFFIPGTLKSVTLLTLRPSPLGV